MKACLETTSMFCFREKSIGLTIIQQNEKSTQIDNSYPTKEEKKEVMEMLYKYKEAFRDEIGTCPT